MKGYIASYNTSYKMNDIEILTHETCANITPVHWSNYYRHVQAQEKSMIDHEPSVDRVKPLIH